MWPQTKGNGLEQFGFIFAKENVLSPSQTPFFFGTCLFPLNATLFARCVSFPFRAVYSANVVLMSGCFDANGGCAVGGARGLMSSKCSGVAERRLLLLTGDEAFAVERIGKGLADGGLN